ncbi:hypothetical protein CYMTET_28018 [Cymbomonas tetramitiformis]|uniref:Uncharacterized protein n=1 Tax=Cymbomonas tetramitiformis TaxID=36881 RepID=A0AAE0KWC1_9CHLO|nr:hypothetical protein CYMTET_28018 [Cymbomonas tetramitiformis]
MDSTQGEAQESIMDAKKLWEDSTADFLTSGNFREYHKFVTGNTYSEQPAKDANKDKISSIASLFHKQAFEPDDDDDGQTRQEATLDPGEVILLASSFPTVLEPPEAGVLCRAQS